MKKHFFSASLFMAFLSLALWTTGCSDDDGYPDVDGQAPSFKLTSEHIQSAQGRTFTIEGTVADADGIATIQLECPDLYLNKTIDLLEIYEKPLETYELKYDFKLRKDEVGEAFTVKVTVTDVGGRSVSQDVLITMDGDFEVPVFKSAPEEGGMLTVLLREGEEPILTLKVSMTDDRALDYLDVTIEGIEGYAPKRVNLNQQAAYDYSEDITFPFEKKDYPLTLAMADTLGNIVTRKAIISVTDVQDFEKMYLADVATDAELNSDVFGVPMCVDHTGEFEYKANYYCEKANTEVYFLPQKTGFTPVCYGIDATDPTKLTDDRTAMKPLVLTEANVYYEIKFNILQKTYEVSTYSVTDAVDPWGTDMVYGTKCLDLWGNKTEYIDFTFGLTYSEPNGVVSFVQDETNPHLFYSKEPLQLTAGEKMHFIIHNYHTSNWWNYVRWCSISSTDVDIFGYYTGSASKNPDYTGPTNTQDVWSEPDVVTTGSYRFCFDSHLGRAKLVRIN